MEMPTATSPLPPAIQEAVVEVSDGIVVTLEVEQIFEQTRSDIKELIDIPLGNEPWMSCFVRTEQIEPRTSDWDQVKKAPGIWVVGKTCDDKFYEVAVCQSYFSWLDSHEFAFELHLHYNRTGPADAEVRVYGILPARRRAQVHFLQNLIRQISLGRGQRFEQYCRRIAPYELQIPLERAILNHHVLKSHAQIHHGLCQWLVFIGLSLDSDFSLVSDLLEKDQDQLLQAFRQDHTDLLEDIPKNQQKREFHRISLYWLLLVSCGAEHDFGPRKLDPRCTAGENANMIGSLISIKRSNNFGDFDSQAMLIALSHSKVFAKDDISLQDIANLASKITTSLRIDFPKGYLNLPTEVAYGLGTGAVNEARTYYQDTCPLLNGVLDTGTLALAHPDRISIQYWTRRTWTPWLHILHSSKSFLIGVSAALISARHDLTCRIQSILSPALWYDFWTVVSLFVFYARILRYLELSLACKIILFSTCGELYAVFQLVHVRHNPQQPDRWFFLICAPLSGLKFILNHVLFFVDRGEFVWIGGLLAFSTLIVRGLQSALPRMYRLVAYPNHDSPVTRREVRDLKYTSDVDVEIGVLDSKLGRQYLRNCSNAALRSEFDYTSYRLVRLSHPGNHSRKEIFEKLDQVGMLHEVSSVLELPDESWEMVVLKSYLPELEIRLGRIFPGCHFHPNYDPTEPSGEDVQRLFLETKSSRSQVVPGEMVADMKRCHAAAKMLKINAFSGRASFMIREGWPVAAAYYHYLVERNVTWSKENAPYS